MPRVGDADFAKRYNDTLGDTTYRLVHGADIVATIPPSVRLSPRRRLIRCWPRWPFRAGSPTSEFPTSHSSRTR